MLQGGSPWLYLAALAGLLLWIVVALRAFKTAKTLSEQAAALTTGRRKEEAALASKTAYVQLVGVTATLSTTIFRLALDLPLYSMQKPPDWLVVMRILANVTDSWANTFGALALSGALSGAIWGGKEHAHEEA